MDNLEKPIKDRKLFEASIPSVNAEAPRSPEYSRLIGLIKSGNLLGAEEGLLEYLQNPPNALANSHRLEVYSHLIRVAAELRTTEKIASYVEEIKKIPLESSADKQMFATCLYMTGMGWLYSSSIERARQHFQKSLDMAIELGSENLMFTNQIALLEILRQEGQYQQVLSQIETLKFSAEPSKDAKNIGYVWNLLGNVYRKQGNYTAAIAAFEKAREYFNTDKNSHEFHYVIWALGTCYAAIEDKEKAKIYLELAARSESDTDQTVQFWRINVLTNLTLAELHTVIGEYEKATSVYTKVAEMTGSDENSYYGRRVLRGQALLAIKKGEFEISNELIDRLVVVAVKDRNQSEIMRLRLLKAEVLLRSGEAAQHEEARAMLQEALAYFQERGVRRHQAMCQELLARLDSASGYPADALNKVSDMLVIAKESSFDRLLLRAQLAQMVLFRKIGRAVSEDLLRGAKALVNKLNAEAERVILSRFSVASYDEWSGELSLLNPNMQRYVNEFFEDFHFVPIQSTDIEIDQNSHYVREKHLGEIPFHNKFTLMRILCLLAETPGKEYSKEQLAKDIWDQEYNPLRHDNNIYININRLRKLIEPNPGESRYVMNGSRGYYFNPAMKVNISSQISDVAPRLVARDKAEDVST